MIRTRRAEPFRRVREARYRFAPRGRLPAVRDGSPVTCVRSTCPCRCRCESWRGARRAALRRRVR
eukprot:2675076-Pleurochrysis_carterae.AAC.1